MCVTACVLQSDNPAIDNVTLRAQAGSEQNNYRVKVNDLGSDPDCDNCGKKPLRIKQPQSMAVNVKLVALDKLKAASIRQSSKPNENRGRESAQH